MRRLFMTILLMTSTLSFSVETQESFFERYSKMNSDAQREVLIKNLGALALSCSTNYTVLAVMAFTDSIPGVSAIGKSSYYKMNEVFGSRPMMKPDLNSEYLLGSFGNAAWKLFEQSFSDLENSYEDNIDMEEVKRAFFDGYTATPHAAGVAQRNCLATFGRVNQMIAVLKEQKKRSVETSSINDFEKGKEVPEIFVGPNFAISTTVEE